LRQAVNFVQEQSARGIVYVHGALGYSRSVGVVAAYLLAAGLAQDVEEAIRRVREVTPQTLLDDVWIRRLHEFAAALPQSTRARS
jgi:protein-tyrosine phosphatase